MKRLKIVAIVGSLRKDSYNRQLALIAKDVIGDRADFELLDYADVPLMNQDPACGSGSLLLKAEKLLGRDGVRTGYFGQEINITTYNLCRINMFLHDVGFDRFDIACEDTLTHPQHWDDEPFELIVSNPAGNYGLTA